MSFHPQESQSLYLPLLHFALFNDIIVYTGLVLSLLHQRRVDFLLPGSSDFFSHSIQALLNIYIVTKIPVSIDRSESETCLFPCK